LQEVKDILSSVHHSLSEEINNADGREIFVQARLNKEQTLFREVKVLARGNYSMAPAVINNLSSGEMVIHNHPSGDLTPSAADIRLASRLGQNGIGFAIINNSVTDIYIVVEAGEVKSRNSLSAEEITSYLKKNGPLEEVLPNFSERDEQIIVTERVIKSFNMKNNSFIEAGTGTGKSFAYLIPALWWSFKNDEKVIVSTNTINLQEQLINKDLVLLAKILPFEFRAVLVKGRSNYLCLRKFENFKKRFLSGKTAIDGEAEQIDNLLDWVDDTASGEKSEINFSINHSLWEKICAESDLCLKMACPYFKKCYFMQARKEIYQANLLVVNHHLLMSDVRLKKDTGLTDRGILPEYHHQIIDEAHNFEEIATQHLGYDFWQSLLEKWLERLHGKKHSLVSKIREDITIIDNPGEDVLKLVDHKLIPVLQKLNDLYPQYFSDLLSFFANNKENKLSVDDQLKASSEWESFNLTADKLQGFLNNATFFMQQIYDFLYEDTELTNDEYAMELESAIKRGQDLNKRIEFNILTDKPDYVYWLEKNYQKKSYQVMQKSAPLKVGDLLPDLIWSKMENTVLTSATLAVDAKFDFIKRDTGLVNADELIVNSPFDYSQQAELIIPAQISEPGSNQFLRDVIKYLEKILMIVSGNVMVLFTSYQMLNEVYEALDKKLAKSVGSTILAQGKFTRRYIMEKFKERSKQIIFGTASFWEGVDIPGDDLKYVIMIKLPFPVPGEPLAKARENLLKSQGLNPFYNYSLPKSVIRFKQGFGRLIRSKNDHGVIILFDKRVLSKSYGKQFLNSLPAGCPVRKMPLNIMEKHIGKMEEV